MNRKNSILLIFYLLLAGCATVEHAAGVFGSTIGTLAGQVESAFQIKKCKKSSSGDNSYFSLAPTTLLQGGDAKAIACYPVSTTANVQVSESRILHTPSGEKITLDVQIISREPGYWQSEYVFTIPLDALPGQYRLIQEITYSGLKFSRSHGFTVYQVN